MVETYSKEVVKEFVLQRLRLTRSMFGKSRADVPSVVRDIGGLQYGGHKIELFNRFENFRPEWFDYWYEKHVLIEGHVLRGALRIINAEDYLYYFHATRSVARRRKYLNCPAFLNDDHVVAANFIEKHGPFTPSDFSKQFAAKYAQYKGRTRKLLSDLYNYGRIARMGRTKQRPLFHVVEKLPYRLDMSAVSEEEAREWLFLKCLGTYGPFALSDVAHWVGWNLTEAKEISKTLLKKGTVVRVGVANSQDIHYARAEDLPILNALGDNLPDSSCVRILFNDDAFLLGYYRHLQDCFGYGWKYPQLSEGIAWRAAILIGRELMGDAIVEMRSNSKFFKVNSLTLRKKLFTSETLTHIEDEFERHAEFQNKMLRMTKPKLM